MAARRYEVHDGDSRDPGALLSDPVAEHVAEVLKAMSTPARLQLLAVLSGAPSGEACVSDLADMLALAQPTVSHHLKVLVEAGLLRRVKRGKRAWYSIRKDRAELVHGLLS